MTTMSDDQQPANYTPWLFRVFNSYTLGFVFLLLILIVGHYH